MAKEKIQVDYEGSLKIETSQSESLLKAIIQVNPPIGIATPEGKSPNVRASEIEVIASCPDFENPGELRFKFRELGSDTKEYPFKYSKNFESVKKLIDSYQVAIFNIVGHHGSGRYNGDLNPKSITEEIDIITKDD